MRRATIQDKIFETPIPNGCSAPKLTATKIGAMTDTLMKQSLKRVPRRLRRLCFMFVRVRGHRMENKTLVNAPDADERKAEAEE